MLIILYIFVIITFQIAREKSINRINLHGLEFNFESTYWILDLCICIHSLEFFVFCCYMKNVEAYCAFDNDF